MVADIQKQQINKAIVEAIAFFDLFDCPLIPMEIWKYLPVKCDLDIVMAILDSDELAGSIENKNGFYFLSGRSKIVITRQERYRFSDRKFKQALKIAGVFKAFPWVKMIAIGNIIGAHNMKDGGDIDFFIIAKRGRIWLARFFCTTIAKILGLRPKLGETRDRICLSFFISEENLDLQRFLLPDGKDQYFIYWLAGLVPIYDKGGSYNKLVAANGWMIEALPNWTKSAGNFQRMIKASFWDFIFAPLDWLAIIFEPVVKKIQLSILPEEIKAIMNLDTRVVINDEVLKMHVNDRRKEYQEKFKNQFGQGI